MGRDVHTLPLQAVDFGPEDLRIQRHLVETVDRQPFEALDKTIAGWLRIPQDRIGRQIREEKQGHLVVPGSTFLEQVFMDKRELADPAGCPGG